MKSTPILVREFDVQDTDPRFWIELVVFYFPDQDLIEIRLRGSAKSVLSIHGFDVLDVHGELLGYATIDVVPTTLDLLFVFNPEPGVECERLSKFAKSAEEYYDFAVLIFQSLKNIQYE